jgi:hypothetical protein
MNKKQFTIVLSGKILHFSEEEIKGIIKKHLKGKNKFKPIFVKLENGNSRLLNHTPLDEPQHFLPWPISIFQRMFVCKLNVYEYTWQKEKIYDKQFLFKDFDKAVNLFLDDVTEDCPIQLQGVYSEYDLNN